MFCLFQQVLLKARSFAHEAGLPFLITEYKDGLQGGPGNATVHSGHHGDRSYAAAFVMRNIPLLTSLDMLSYWTFTDGKGSRSLCVSFRRSSKKAVAQCSRRAGACPAGPSTANSGASRRKASGSRSGHLIRKPAPAHGHLGRRGRQSKGTLVHV